MGQEDSIFRGFVLSGHALEGRPCSRVLKPSGTEKDTTKPKKSNPQANSRKSASSIKNGKNRLLGRHVLDMDLGYSKR